MLNNTLLINFIRETIPHIPVQPDALDRIRDSFEETAWEKGEYLLKRGKISGYFILLAGHVRAYTFDEFGDEITTNFYSPPRVVIEAASFFLHQPSHENLVALSPCAGFYTTFDKLNTLFHLVPEFREFGRAILVKEFVSAQQQKLDFINQSAEQRYLTLLTRHPDLLQYAQLRHIASYLGITDTSLSRIRREMTRR